MSIKIGDKVTCEQGVYLIQQKKYWKQSIFITFTKHSNALDILDIKVKVLPTLRKWKR